MTCGIATESCMRSELNEAEFERFVWVACTVMNLKFEIDLVSQWQKYEKYNSPWPNRHCPLVALSRVLDDIEIQYAEFDVEAVDGADQRGRAR